MGQEEGAMSPSKNPWAKFDEEIREPIAIALKRFGWTLKSSAPGDWLAVCDSGDFFDQRAGSAGGLLTLIEEAMARPSRNEVD